MLHTGVPSVVGGMGGKLVSGTLLISSRGIALIASVTSPSIGRSECTGAILTSKAALCYQAGPHALESGVILKIAGLRLVYYYVL